MNDAIRDEITRLGELRLPELQARYAEVVGETTQCPNKAWLIRRIGEAMERSGATRPEVDAATAMPQEPAPIHESGAVPEPGTSPEPGVEVPSPAQRRLRELSVAELQALHLEIIGRPTGSSHVGYLQWRLRQAERGRIRVGAKRQTQREGHPAEGSPADFKVLPFRMDAGIVARLDEARERLGLSSRTELLRRALHDYLLGVGERDVAELLLPEGAA